MDILGTEIPDGFHVFAVTHGEAAAVVCVILIGAPVPLTYRRGTFSGKVDHRICTVEFCCPRTVKEDIGFNIVRRSAARVHNTVQQIQFFGSRTHQIDIRRAVDIGHRGVYDIQYRIVSRDRNISAVCACRCRGSVVHSGVQHIHRHISGNIHIHASAGHGVQCHGIQCQTESGIGIGSGKRDPACAVGHIQMRECHIIFRRHTEDTVCTCAVQRHIGNAVTIHIPVDLQREFHAACRRTDLKGTAESDGPFAVRKDRTVKINDIIAVGCRRVDPDQCFPQRGHAVGIIHRILQRGDRDDRTCRSFIHSKIAGNDL